MKTACEEAADVLTGKCWLDGDMPTLPKRLRAEGRKIVQYERQILQWYEAQGVHRSNRAAAKWQNAYAALCNTALRIQKSGKGRK